MTDPSKVTMLVIAIGALSGVIVWLVIGGTKYIKKLHQKSDERLLSLHKENWERAEKFIQAINNLHKSDEAMVQALENNSGTIERCAATISDLHKFILKRDKDLARGKN